MDIAPESPWEAKHLSQREGKSSCWWWLNFSIAPICLHGLDQVLPAHSANYPRQGRAHHGDQPLLKTRIVFIFVQCYCLWRKGQAVVFFHRNFSPSTKGRGWKVFHCRRNGECRGSVCPGGSVTARCRRAAAPTEKSPTSAPERK